MSKILPIKSTLDEKYINETETITEPALEALIAGGYLFKGVAHPGDAAVTPDANIFVIATEAGTYTNFKNSSNVALQVADGEVAVLKYNGSWSKEVTGAATAAEVTALGQEVDDLSPLTLEIGSISGGVNIDNPARARNIGHLLRGCVVTLADGYTLVGYYTYSYNNGDYTYISYQEVGLGGEICLHTRTYYRFIIKRNDGADFTKEELPAIITSIVYSDTPFEGEDILSNFGEVFRIDTSGWLNGYVNSSKVVTAGASSLCSQPIELKKGDTLITQSYNDYLYPILIVASNNSINIGDTIVPIDFVQKDNQNSSYGGIYTYKAKNNVFAIVSVATSFNRVAILRNPLGLVSPEVKDRLHVLPDDAATVQAYYINSSNRWEVGGKSVCFNVFSGSKVSIRSNSSYNAIYALLKKTFIPEIIPYHPDPSFMDGETGRHTIPVNSSVDIMIPEDGYLYVYVNTDLLLNYYPNNVDIYYPEGIMVRVLNTSSADGYLNRGINSENVWKGQSIHIPASCYFNVNTRDKVKITANSSSYAIIAFLKNTAGMQDESANFANGTNGRITIPAGTSQEFSIIENCLLYVYIQADSTTTNYIPSEIILTSVADVQKEIQVTRQAVNLAKTINLFTGVNNSGKLIADMSHVAVGPVLINNGGAWYKKARYIHACCYANGLYAFNATKIVFLTDAKSVISVVTNVSAAIEIPATAYWAVVEFPSNSQMHFVAINNQSLLKTYSAYDEHNLVADVLPIYSRIQNTDGAISHMIDVALDYMPYYYLGMGYGDIATAFDDVVEPVESEFPDTNPQHYDGEKLQMNCSTFVMLCLLGVFYKNSRYNTPNGENIGNGYVFDEQAEYNYFYTKAPYQYIFGANFGKMYANKLAKYAFDRGLLYLIKPDLSNIRPGDVLFDGSTIDGNFFMNIGHTMFVVDVELNADGSKRVTIFETASGVRVLTYGAEHYGARFPLPNRNIIFDDIVADFSPINQSITTTENVDISLGTYNLSKNIQNKKHYTLEVVGDMPDSVNVGIKGGTKTVEINRRELYKRGDGVNTKHFWFLMNDPVDISQISLYINSSAALSGQTIKIDSLRISEGYFTL